MAVYGSEAGMTAALGADVLKDIADHDNSGVVDVGLVDAALARASSFADGFLSAYLPLTTVPDALERAVYDIAAQQIRLGRNQGTDDSKLAYDNAVAWLKMIAAGTVVLDVPVPPDDDVVDPGDPQIEAEARVFTRTTMRGMI